MLPIEFEKPIWLLLLLLIIPCFLIARRSIGGLSRGKATATFALRVLVILLLSTALARPIWEKRGEGVTVTILLDRSLSIPLPLKASSVSFLRKAVEAKANREDRVAVITIAKDANIVAMPDSYSAVTPGSDEGDLTATNLASGVRTALAVMPPDTANRIVLASDGNETIDSVLEAAEIAKANHVPIDVLNLEYEHDREIIFERVIAPARARKGQTINVKLALRAQNDAAGTIHLKMNGQPVDLDPDAEGDGVHVQLRAGPAMVFPVTLKMDSSGPMQFDAVFTPDNPADDGIDRNNSAVAVTFVSGEGKVLVVDDGTSESEFLVRALEQARMSVDVRKPGEITGAVMLAGYDAVILANIPRYAFDDQQDKTFHAYVHDLGGGLVMLGGPDSFGAGGWIDSEVSKVLPVKLDPPETKQQVRGALALVMHSCEMPQGNYWGQQVAISAIQALSSLDYVGICVYNWGAGGPNINGASWALPMTMAGDKSVPINAAKKMVVGDMPDFEASMQLAFNGLMSVRAGQRHTIIISDGDPAPPSSKLLNQFVANKITVTTVMVAGHGSASDNASMNNTAKVTGGRFYNITNPKNLPQIFIKEAQIVSRSLIQEDTYRPQFASHLPGPTEGFDGVPQIQGYVLTAPREGLAQSPIIVQTSDGPDPIYAYWNYGLGKSIAYTSDLNGRWGGQWVSWSQFRAFWEQSIRWVMRPSSPANLIVNTRQEGDRAVVEVEALDANAAFLNFLQTSAVVLHPDGNASPLSLQQVGPGKYRGDFRTDDPGAYLVNINYASGSGDAATHGNLQAAVTVPYAREFKDVRNNTALLKDLANKTGGRELQADPNAPETADLFNRDKLEVPKSPKEIWDVVAMIAAALFVLDVAARRLTIDPKWIAAIAGRLVGKRGEASTDTVAAWKRAKSQVTQQRPQGKSKTPAADRTVRYEAGEEDKKTAIDVGAQIPKEMRPTNEPPARAQKTPEVPKDEGDYTSRLLAAKKRARGGDDDEKKPTT